MSSKRTLKTLSLGEKYRLLKEVEGGARKKDVALKYGVPASTVSTILKKKDTIISAVESGGACGNSKRLKKPMYASVDEAVLAWFKSTRTQNLPISGGLIKEKALEFSLQLGELNFKASTGWLDNWKRRSGICQVCGDINEVSDEDCTKWQRDTLPNLLKNYQAEDIFNADETGLFFNCLPDNILTFKNQKCHGEKNSKQRVTLMIGTNMNGSEKLKLLLIGKSSEPRCFRGIKWLPLDYRANKNAWMTGKLFEEWLLKLDRQFASAKRNIILFIDNCPAHSKDLQLKLEFIKLAFFPPNMSSKLQPLNQGVIQTMKCHYRRRILKKTLNCLTKNKKINISLMDCVDEISNAWNMDVKSETIANCFRKAGFDQYSECLEEGEIPLHFLSESLKETSEAEIQLQQQYEAWKNVQDSQGVTLHDYLHVDDDVVTSEFSTDEEIVQYYSSESEVVQNNENEMTDDDLKDDMQQPPSNESIANSLSILRSFFKTNENTTDSLYNGLNNIEAFFENQNKKSS